MQYIWLNFLRHEIDDPSDTYAELDGTGRERRRIDFYQNGMCFAYGGERGRQEVLSLAPYPENPCTLNRPGEVEVRRIEGRAFEELWEQSAEWPTGFMELLN